MKQNMWKHYFSVCPVSMQRRRKNRQTTVFIRHFEILGN